MPRTATKDSLQDERDDTTGGRTARGNESHGR